MIELSGLVPAALSFFTLPYEFFWVTSLPPPPRVLVARPWPRTIGPLFAPHPGRRGLRRAPVDVIARGEATKQTIGRLGRAVAHGLLGGWNARARTRSCGRRVVLDPRGVPCCFVSILRTYSDPDHLKRGSLLMQSKFPCVVIMRSSS